MLTRWEEAVLNGYTATTATSFFLIQVGVLMPYITGDSALLLARVCDALARCVEADTQDAIAGKLVAPELSMIAGCALAAQDAAIKLRISRPPQATMRVNLDSGAMQALLSLEQNTPDLLQLNTSRAADAIITGTTIA